MKENIQASTFNAERLTGRHRSLLIGWSALKVECSILLLFALSTLSLFGQANTNGLTTLNPPYGKLPPTFWEQYGTAMIVVGIVVVVLIALALWLGLRPRSPDILPPAEQARQALEVLRQRPENGALLSEVSAILRKYFIAAFGLSPGEFTTTEFCQVITGHEHIGEELSAQVAAFLRQCDERKFKPANPGIPLGAVSRALELVTLAEERKSQLQDSVAAATEHAAPTKR